MAGTTDKKESPKTEKEESFVKKLIRFFSDQRTKYGIGIILLGITAFSLLAFISFFFTGSTDESIIQQVGMGDLTGEQRSLIANWAGVAGAYLSEFFINDCFGIASFAFVYFSFILALRFMRIRVLALWKAVVYASVSLIWTSVTISFFFSDLYGAVNSINWGGAHGEIVSQYLQSYLGWFGTFLSIVGSFIIFAIIVSAATIPFLQRCVIGIRELFHKSPKNEDVGTEEALLSPETPEQEEILNEPEEEEMEISVPVDDPFETIDEPVEEDGNEWIVVDEAEGIETTSAPVTTDVDIDDNEDFEIVVAEGDEVVSDLTNLSPAESILANLGEYDPKKDLSRYKYPTLDLLTNYGNSETQVNLDEQNANKERITTTLKNYGIEIDSIKATVGPTITLYEIVPKAGVRISKIKNLESDIMLSLAAIGIRIIAPIPGKGTIGIEVPNNDPQMVSMYSILASKRFQESHFALPIAFGRTITNEVFMVDLAKMPHLLVAGATGQGKSVGLNAVITSLLYKKHPSELKFVMIDPKKVEFSIYSKIERHFLAKLPDDGDAIITDVTKVVQTLNSLCKEMDDRYMLLKDAQVRNLAEYNEKFTKRKLNPEKGHKFLPYIVVIVDEFGDLIMVAGKEVELPIARIAQLARAVGIHMIIATQRPSVNIITGVIKANFPARVAFRVSSQIDSRTILDATGANQLVGRGDMLFSQGSDLVRVQCAFVDTPEVEQIADYIGAQQGYPTAFFLPEYHVEGGEGSDLSAVDLSKRDPMFEDAARLLIAHQQGSTSLIQRKFAIGYNRAGRIMDQLEAAGIVGPFEGSKARQVLLQDEYSLEQKLQSL